jgi:hypothetical protein
MTRKKTTKTVAMSAAAAMNDKRDGERETFVNGILFRLLLFLNVEAARVLYSTWVAHIQK